MYPHQLKLLEKTDCCCTRGTKGKQTVYCSPFWRTDPASQSSSDSQLFPELLGINSVPPHCLLHQIRILLLCSASNIFFHTAGKFFAATWCHSSWLLCSAICYQLQQKRLRLSSAAWLDAAGSPKCTPTGSVCKHGKEAAVTRDHLKVEDKESKVLHLELEQISQCLYPSVPLYKLTHLLP